MEEINSSTQLPRSALELLNSLGSSSKLTEPQTNRGLSCGLRTQYGADPAAKMSSVTHTRGMSEFVDGVMFEW